MRIVFVGKEEKGFFAGEVAEKHGWNVEFITPALAIEEQAQKILQCSDCKYVIYDVEQYTDSAEKIADVIHRIQLANNATPIIYASGYDLQSDMIRFLRFHGVQHFIFAAYLDEKKQELERAIQGIPMLDAVEEDQEALETNTMQPTYKSIGIAGVVPRMGTTTQGKATVCVGTCYNYINNNLFPNITLTDLPYRRRKKKNRYQDRIQKRGPRKRGRSIEERPERISLRMERGHWEMDTVVGRRATKNCLLVLTERKTRYEIVRLLKEHTTEEVVKALDRLEREIGEKVFRKIFQSITMDNGSEFMDFEGIMRSRRNKMNRTETYYCHAYSSWERGSNENQNRFIRRYIPKGQSFEKCCKKDVQEIEDWMNSYPRQMFDGRSAEDLFLEEFQENPWRKAG